jgi:tripartite-type tricarboxylate transporter receptor subunit TctC
MRLHAGLVAALGALALLATAPAAQAWPDKPVKVIVPFGPGGPGDVILRVMTEELKKKWNQPVIVDYKPGAGGIIAHKFVAESPADGLTLLQGASSYMTYHLLTKDLGFEPVKDLKIAAIYGVAQTGFTISGAVPARTVQEFVAWTKANPGKVNYASLGRSSVLLASELFKAQTGAQMSEIPYKSVGEAQQGLLRDDVQLFVTTMTQVKPHFPEGKLKPLFVFTDKRISILPDVPTYQEVGLPDFKIQFWQTLMMPAGTPDAIRKQINDDVRQVVALPEMQEKLLVSGNEPMGPTLPEIDKMVSEASKRWAEAAQVAKIQPE